jgi:hypothetical protein
MGNKTAQFYVENQQVSDSRMDMVVNANTNGLPVTINNALPVVSVGSSNNIDLAAGLLTGYSHINKFGATDGDITGGTVWDGNSAAVTYPYPSNSVVAVASTANSGANVYIEGLDASYNLQNETVAIGSSGTKTFSRIFRAYMVAVNNDADVTLSLDGTVAAKIIEDLGQTLMAVYTVPAGKTGYLFGLTFSSDKASVNSAMTYTLRAKEITDGGVFRIKGIFYSAGGQTFDHRYPVPLKLNEKTDIKVDCVAAQSATVSATFDIVLVDN